MRTWIGVIDTPERELRKELRELARWVTSLANRMDTLKRQAEALQREAREKAPWVQASRERLERDARPSEMRDGLIGQFRSLQTILDALAAMQL